MGDSLKEPATLGRVLLNTSVGPLDVELWTKECPVAAKNFIQHCLDGYYDGCEFFRVLKGQLVMTGDPSNTGAGGVSIYPEEPYFNVERHSRLRFRHRGMLGMTRQDPEGTSLANQNGSQFFITFNRCDELNGHSTLFGKLSVDTIWNALRLDELALDEDDRPLAPPRIISAEVINDPFSCERRTEVLVEGEQPKTLVEPEATAEASPPIRVVRNSLLLSFSKAHKNDESSESEEELSEFCLKPSAVALEQRSGAEVPKASAPAPESKSGADAGAIEHPTDESLTALIETRRATAISGPYTRTVVKHEGLRSQLRKLKNSQLREPPPIEGDGPRRLL